LLASRETHALSEEPESRVLLSTAALAHTRHARSEPWFDPVRRLGRKLMSYLGIGDPAGA